VSTPWKGGKQIHGYTGPIDVVLDRIIIDPIVPIGNVED